MQIFLIPNHVIQVSLCSEGKKREEMRDKTKKERQKSESKEPQKVRQSGAIKNKKSRPLRNLRQIFRVKYKPFNEIKHL